MNALIGKAAYWLGFIILIAIRAPHGKRSKETKIAESRKGAMEVVHLIVAVTGNVLLPLAYLVSPLLSYADYPLRPVSLVCGIACLCFSYWLIYRSHTDLGTNWSYSLELRENHRLISSGIYKSIRHPMYVSGIAFALAQALLLSNWIAGPGGLVAMVLLVIFRVPSEEKMMLEKFGNSYRDYMTQTTRFIPGIW